MNGGPTTLITDVDIQLCLVRKVEQLANLVPLD